MHRPTLPVLRLIVNGDLRFQNHRNADLSLVTASRHLQTLASASEADVVARVC